MNLRSLLLLAPLLASAQDSYTAPRVVAVGDVHGDFGQLTTVLRDAGLIDARNQWTGGKAHLVQTGDVPDRGPETRQALELLMDLERQAKKAGGAVHALIGNHEAMNVYGDLRYVTPAEFAAFQTKDSAKVRQQYWERLADEMKQNPAGQQPDDAFRAKWEAETPPGFIEHRMAYGPEGQYGKWIRRHNTVVKVNDTIFLHGGIGPKYADWTLKAINEKIREELKDFAKLPGGVTQDEAGPLWYRGPAELPESEQAALVDLVLAKQGVKRIVMAHTPGPGVRTRFGGKVVLIDVGMSKVYGGPAACLVLEGAEAFTIHQGKKMAIPAGVELAK